MTAASSIPRRFSSLFPSLCHLFGRKDLAGIHDVAWVEGPFERAHGVEFQRRLVVGELLALGLADAMLGAEAAGKGADDVQHDLVDVVGVARCGVVPTSARNEA